LVFPMAKGRSVPLPTFFWSSFHLFFFYFPFSSRVWFGKKLLVLVFFLFFVFFLNVSFPSPPQALTKTGIFLPPVFRAIFLFLSYFFVCLLSSVVCDNFFPNPPLCSFPGAFFLSEQVHNFNINPLQNMSTTPPTPAIVCLNGVPFRPPPKRLRSPPRFYSVLAVPLALPSPQGGGLYLFFQKGPFGHGRNLMPQLRPVASPRLRPLPIFLRSHPGSRPVAKVLSFGLHPFCCSPYRFSTILLLFPPCPGLRRVFLNHKPLRNTPIFFFCTVWPGFWL